MFSTISEVRQCTHYIGEFAQLGRQTLGKQLSEQRQNICDSQTSGSVDNSDPYANDFARVQHGIGFKMSGSWNRIE
ncbi:hypothetical protein DICVIV_13935 [Dictyocaulus viviparus]|uniref:Uncharacterized protein n=1 Tax=Dictyocaulus viviparus TaxID=29172 RepID=A0A0D8XCE0_DICVI|nr:hypothetical protein DICVIV_13935 [Dictyocaulus viviparus]